MKSPLRKLRQSPKQLPSLILRLKSLRSPLRKLRQSLKRSLSPAAATRTPLRPSSKRPLSRIRKRKNKIDLSSEI